MTNFIKARGFNYLYDRGSIQRTGGGRIFCLDTSQALAILYYNTRPRQNQVPHLTPRHSVPSMKRSGRIEEDLISAFQRLPEKLLA